MAKKKTEGKGPVEGDIISAMDGKFADWFPGGTWDPWKVILRAAYGMPLNEDELTFFHEVAGGRAPPTKRVRRLWIVAGRRAGKNAITSLIVAHAAAQFGGTRRRVAGITLPQMRKGERATILVANDREQAGVAFRYIESYFTDIPELAAMVTRPTRDTIELGNGIDIVVATNDFRGIRGRSVLIAILDECAFYRSENSSSSDVELYNAITPGMLTLKDQAMLIGISSAHKKAGLLYDRYRESYGKDDPDVLVIKAMSLQLNPTLDVATIEAEIAADPELKRAEYLCEWRTDISSFVMPEIVDAAIMKGRQVLAPSGEDCTGYIDVSGGARDAHAIAVSFQDKGTGQAVLACAREVKTADTESVVSEFSSILKSYGLTSAYADRYGAQWVVDAFKRHGIDLKKSPHDRTGIYLNALPALNAGQIKLLDLPRIRSQLLALERRIIRGSGRDVVDHPQAGADDLILCVCGSLFMAASGDRNKITYCFATDREGGWERYMDEAKATIAASASQIAPGDENLSYQDRARRAAMGANWRSQIPPSDPHIDQ